MAPSVSWRYMAPSVPWRYKAPSVLFALLCLPLRRARDMRVWPVQFLMLSSRGCHSAPLLPSTAPWRMTTTVICPKWRGISRCLLAYLGHLAVSPGISRCLWASHRVSLHLTVSMDISQRLFVCHSVSEHLTVIQDISRCLQRLILFPGISCNFGFVTVCLGISLGLRASHFASGLLMLYVMWRNRAKCDAHVRMSHELSEVYVYQSFCFFQHCLIHNHKVQKVYIILFATLCGVTEVMSTWIFRLQPLQVGSVCFYYDPETLLHVPSNILLQPFQTRSITVASFLTLVLHWVCA